MAVSGPVILQQEDGSNLKLPVKSCASPTASTVDTTTAVGRGIPVSNLSPKVVTPLPARERISTFGNDDELGNELPANWTLVKFQDEVKKVLAEYFVSMEIEGAAMELEDILSKCPTESDELGVLSIRSALDRDDAAQRAVVNLLCRLSSSSALDRSALIRCFEKLFSAWADIAIDAPQTPQQLLGILHGCVAGGITCPTFATRVPENLLKAGLKEGRHSYTDMLTAVANELKVFKEKIAPILEEFFVAFISDEVTTSLKELNMQPYHHEFVKKAITMSYSLSNEEAGRTETLSLFAKLSAAQLISKDDLQWGITRLLGQLDDLELDCPRVVEKSTEFCACLVIDELVSVPFLRRCRLLRIGGPSGLRVLEGALRRTPEYGKRHLNTEQFKKELEAMILEYFNSGDKEEFGRCTSDLAPLSNARGAELIRKVMSLAMERDSHECEKSLELILWLARHEELEADAIEKGFDDLYKRMPDLLLDVPDAQEMARSFVAEAKKAGVLRKSWPDAEEE